MDHYIKEVLKIKYYIRYQDDFLLFHPSKEYLKSCLNNIRSFLKSEKLELKQKTFIFKSTNNFVFLGRKKNGRYAKYPIVKRKIKKRKYLYTVKNIGLSSLANTLICYKNLLAKKYKI